jgi:predicted nucleic acid-binding protein
MASSAPRVYLDACVLLSYIEDDADRMPDIEELLRRGAAGELELLTSVLSHVEVAYLTEERDAGRLSEKARDAIEALWLHPSPVRSVEFYPQLAAEARELVRRAMVQGNRLTPTDAIHLATAASWGCPDFFTYDNALRKFMALVGLSIGPPMNPQAQLGL